VFQKGNMEIDVQDDARKRKIDYDAAWEIIKEFQSVMIGKGQKAVTYKPDDSEKEEILKAAMGRSGNLRAPAIKVNDKLIIGFNELMYKELA